MKKIIAVLFCLNLANLIWADVPKTINYQGRLTDLSGNAVSDATYSVVIRIYDSSTALEAASIWSDIFSVTTKNGYFSVVLGSGAAISASVDFNKPYWVGIKVGSDLEMTPRQPLNGVPYAFGVPDNSITTEKIKDHATTNTWYVNGAAIGFNAASQTHTLASLTVTPAKDGVLFIWGKGALSSNTGDFILVTNLKVNGTIVDGQEVFSTSYSLNSKCVSVLQYAQPVLAGTTYNIETSAYTQASAYNGTFVANKLMAVVYYK